MTDPNLYQQNVLRALHAARQAGEDQRRLAEQLRQRRTNQPSAARKSYPRRANGTLWDRFLQFLDDL